MSVKGLFAWFTHPPRSSQPSSDEEGIMISRRLQELLDFAKAEYVDKLSSAPNRERDAACHPPIAVQDIRKMSY